MRATRRPLQSFDIKRPDSLTSILFAAKLARLAYAPLEAVGAQARDNMRLHCTTAIASTSTSLLAAQAAVFVDPAQAIFIAHRSSPSRRKPSNEQTAPGKRHS